MGLTQTIGNRGEDEAASFLINKGYEIISRNWRFGHLEIDIICQDQRNIVFVEVKTRRNASYGGAIGAITLRKIKNLSRAAQVWLTRHHAWMRPCRFDIVCVTGTPANHSINHYEDAFPYVASLDHFHSHW